MLKSQLNEIAQNNAFSQKVNRKVQPSVLFSEKEASDIELDTIYAIGCNGLRSLIALDPQNNLVFKRFQKTLFSPQSKSFDRSYKSKDELKALDGELKAFLTCLQPFMLINSSLKCIEWLIRRFQVHLYNSHDLILCALPYCDQQELFSKIICIHDLKFGAFEFLRVYAASQLPVGKEVLIAQALSKSNRWLFSAACELLMDAFQNPLYKSFTDLHKIRSNFLLSIALPAMYESEVDENFLLKLLPVIMECLKDRHSHEIHVFIYSLIYYY